VADGLALQPAAAAVVELEAEGSRCEAFSKTLPDVPVNRKNYVYPLMGSIRGFNSFPRVIRLTANRLAVSGS
jgi:hypothetical protein